MIDIAVLKSELTLDPLALGYAPFLVAGNDGALAALLNDNTRGFKRAVSPYMINARSLMAQVGAVVGASVLDKLDAARATNSPVKWAFSFLTSLEGIDVAHPQTRAMLDALVKAGVLLQTESDAVKALGVVPASRAEVLFGTAVNVDHVVQARTR